MAEPSGLLGDVNSWLQLAIAIAAALGLARGLGKSFAATVGRPWQLSRKVAQIVPGSRLESVRDLIGPPKFGNKKRQTWVFPECFIEVASDGGQVLAFAVTLRRPWFRVPLPVPMNLDPLGKATFARITERLPEHLGTMGANRWGYSELVPATSASNFQEFAISLNDAGIVLDDHALDLVKASDWGAGERHEILRGKVRFNTFAISAPNASLDCLRVGPSYGVSLYQARLSPSAKPAWMTWPVMRATPWGRRWNVGK